MVAETALSNPYCNVMAAPIASKAKNEIAPKAVLATRNRLHFRADFAVKRNA